MSRGDDGDEWGTTDVDDDNGATVTAGGKLTEVATAEVGSEVTAVAEVEPDLRVLERERARLGVVVGIVTVEEEGAGAGH